MSRNSSLSIKGLIHNYAGLPRSIYVLFVARIINRFGGFVHILLSLILSMYLGMNGKEIGTYILISGAAGFFGTYIGGKLGDKYSRKKVYLIAQTMAALMFLPCAYFVVYDIKQVPLFLILSALFSAVIRPVGNAMVADLVSKEDRKRAFSLLYLGINFGVALGPLVGTFLLENHLVWLFLGDAMTTFIAVLLVALFVEEHRITEEEIAAIDENDGEFAETGNVFLAFLKRPLLMVFIGFALINSMMYAQVNFAFPLLVKAAFDDGLFFLGRLMAFNAIVVIVLTSLIHYLTQKIKPIYNIAIASLLYAIGMGMMTFILSKGMFVLSIFIWTLGEIQAVTNQNVYLMSHTPINYRARFMGIISIVTSIGYVVSPRLSGTLIDSHGQSALWQVVFVGGIIAAVGFTVIGIFESKKEKIGER